ncbi:MAG: discoidin domain-containing protein [Paludibacteraceae bacterium]|nr:discoidin domain-containing protein [Paludibacteraceae bacterium]
MKKISFLFALLCASMMSYAAIDWSGVAWLGNGVGEGYTEKYKAVVSPALPSPGYINNLQLKGSTPVLHVSFPSAAFGAFSLASSKYEVEGAGVFFHLDAFTAQETEFTVVCSDITYTFTVFYADGAAGSVSPVEVYDTNFALASNGASATSSSGVASNAIDGNNGSRWESSAMDPQEFMVDLGQARIFNTVQIRWEGAYAKTFDIDVSSDGETWTNVVKIEDVSLAGFPNEQTYTFDKITARYVRFNGIARGTGYGYSFYEFRVLLPGVSTLTTINLSAADIIAKVGQGVNLTLQTLDQNGQAMQADVNYEITPADAGAVENGVYIPAKVGAATIVAKSGEVVSGNVSVFGYAGDNLALSTNITTDNKVIAQSEFAPNGTDAFFAVDGNDGSVWQGSATNGTAGDDEARTFDSWFVLDLGAFYNIDLVTIKFEGACSQLYHLDFSADNSVWNEAYNYVGNAGVNGHTDVLSTQLANTTKVRYVRFWSTKAATGWGMKMYEMKVFGQEWIDSGDTEKPVMGEASVESKSWNNVVINVAATDNGTVVAYHVVDATNSIDKNCNVNDGKITVSGLEASTAYSFTITAIDAAQNESDNNAVVAVTTNAHLVAPAEAAPTPTWPAAQVIAFYSDTYQPASTWNYNAGWGQATQLQEKDIDNNHYLSYTNFNYLGWVLTGGTPYNALAMEKLHVDIWSENDAQVKLTPIYGGDGLATDDLKGKMLTLTGQQWNSFDLDLSTDFAGLNLSSIFQVKFSDGSAPSFCVDNVYFYRTTPIVDNEAPTNVSASMASASYFSVRLALSADDNQGIVNFKVLLGETEMATIGGTAGAVVNVDVKGLAAGSNYTLDVVCYDGNDNYAADTVHVAAATLAGPAADAAPLNQNYFVKSIFSDAYTAAPAAIGSFISAWWEPPAMSRGPLAENDEALYYAPATTGMIGWDFSNINVTDYPYLHISIYPMASGTIKIYPVVAGGEGDYNRVVEVTGNQWNHLVLDYSGMNLDNVAQMGWIDYYALNGFFIDNVYFSMSAESGVVAESDRRINAYGLNMVKDGDNYTFSYYANIAGTAANLIFYKDGVVQGTIALDAPVAGLNTKTVDKHELPVGEGLTWAVELTADPVYVFKQYFAGDDLMKCHLAMDNSPESDYFGRMYVANRAGAGSGGIYVYNPDYTVHTSNTLAGQAKWQSMGRPSVGVDGTVYVADWGDSHGGIYVMNPQTLVATNFFVGTQASNGLWTNADGVAMGSSTAAVGVYGEGANTVLYAMNEDVSSAGTTLYKNGVNVYQIGQEDGTVLSTWNTAPTKTFALLDNAAEMFVLNVNEHGVFFSSSRGEGNNAAGARSLQFYNHNGERTFVALPADATADLTGSLGGGCAVSRDASQLAIVDGKKNILVYDIAWTEDTPALTLVAKYATSYAAHGSLSFDYAGNLVGTAGANYNNSTSSKLVAYGVPTMDNTVVVPAKKSLVVENEGYSVGVDNVNSVESVRKVVENGQVYIIRDGMQYTVTGVRVK